MLMDSACFAEEDVLLGVTENILLGQLAKVGTGDMDTLLDEKKVIEGAVELVSNEYNSTMMDAVTPGGMTPYQQTPMGGPGGGQPGAKGEITPFMGGAAFSPMIDNTAGSFSPAVGGGESPAYMGSASPVYSASPGYSPSVILSALFRNSLFKYLQPPRSLRTPVPSILPFEVRGNHLMSMCAFRPTNPLPSFSFTSPISLSPSYSPTRLVLKSFDEIIESN